MTTAKRSARRKPRLISKNARHARRGNAQKRSANTPKLVSASLARPLLRLQKTRAATRRTSLQEERVEAVVGGTASRGQATSSPPREQQRPHASSSIPTTPPSLARHTCRRRSLASVAHRHPAHRRSRSVNLKGLLAAVGGALRPEDVTGVPSQAPQHELEGCN